MRTTLLFLFLLSPCLIQAADPPRKISWELLRDVTFKKKWNAEEGMFILEPQFGAKVKEIQAKEVAITGYMIPVDIDVSFVGRQVQNLLFPSNLKESIVVLIPMTV